MVCKGKELVITYIVDSPGGSVNAVLKFVDFISLVKRKYPKIKFTSIATGLIASAGTIMCAVADKRMATKYSKMMLHELSSGNNGTYTHLLSYTKHLTNIHDTLLDIYLGHCNGKKTRAELEIILLNETWYCAEEYLACGFIDEIC